MTADVHTLAGAYALNALERDEREFFERHLAACLACQREVAELRATAARLGSAAAKPAPGHLRDRVLAEVAATRQLPPIDAGTAITLGQRFRPLLSAAAALAFIIAVGTSLLSVQLGNRLADVEAELQDVQARADAGEELAAVLGGANAHVTMLEAPAGVRAHLVSSEGAGHAVLITDGLPRPAEGLAYQVWVLRDGVPLPDRVFQPDPDGRALIAMEHGVSAADLVAVTVEPADGSVQPTGEIIVQGPVDSGGPPFSPA